MPQAPLDFQSVRKIAITALFSDDILFEKIVLKGGNALNIVLDLSDRTSLDLDFSLENDFEDLEDIRKRMLRALENRFNAAGYVVFDFSLEPRPTVPRENSSHKWGGYAAEFKLMEDTKFESLTDDIAAIRRDSLVIGPGQQRTFRIDLSKCEYVNGKMKTELDKYEIYVYTAEMIAIEKLRAICQQMPEYTRIGLRPREPETSMIFA